MSLSTWFTSSLSGGSSNCVEVRLGHDTVSIRDSKYRRDPANDPATEPIITAAMQPWIDFIDQVDRSGRAPTTAGPLHATTAHDGTVTLTSRPDGTTLRYTPAEWDAFVGGVRLGEFHPRHQAA